MADSKRYKIPIPDGYRVYEKEFNIAGLHYRKRAFSNVIKKGQATFGLQPEPNNKHDRNAIKVMGERKGLFGKVEKQIGYLPAEIAARIAESGVLYDLFLRPKYMWVGDRGGVDFTCDLLGPKKKYKAYKDAQ